MDAEVLWNDTSYGLDPDLFIKENTRKSCQRIRSQEDANQIQIPQYCCAAVNPLHKNERNIAMPFGPAADYAINADSSPCIKALPGATGLLGSILQRLQQGSRWPRAASKLKKLSRLRPIQERLRDVLVEYGQNDWRGSFRTVNDPCAQQCSEFSRGDGTAHCAWFGRSWPRSRCHWPCAVPYLQCGLCDKRGTCRGLSKLCRSA